MKKFKILIFVLVFMVMFTVLAVPCFAFDTVSGESYTFIDVVDFSSLPQQTVYINVEFSCNGDSYDRITLSYRGYYVMSYHHYSLNTDVDVYKEDSGWVSDAYKTIVFSYDDSIVDGSDFLTDNELKSSDNFYSLIYDIIMTNVYGDITITPDMKLTVSLIATVLSILCILAPILICAAIFVWILKRV